jgi:hypothetical protein
MNLPAPSHAVEHCPAATAGVRAAATASTFLPQTALIKPSLAGA